MIGDESKGAAARVGPDPAWVGWAALAGFGMVVGVAGLLGPLGRAPDGGSAVRLVAHIPDPLNALALISGALAALLLLWLLFPRGVRRRRNDDEQYEFYHEPAKVSPWVLIVLWAMLVLPFAVGGYFLWHGSRLFEERGASFSPHAPGVPVRPEPAPLPPGLAPEASPPLWTAAVTALALCAGLGSLALLLWLAFGDRLARWWAGSPPAGRSERLVSAVDESLDDLERELDARIAIIKCYRRFEQVLARSRFPRAPWQTPMEFMRAALGRLALPASAVRRLTELFELARFSNEPLTAAERGSAFASLAEIRTSLSQERPDVETA